MKDLRSMAGQGGKSGESGGDTYKDETMKTINNFAGMNEAQLMSELMGAVAKRRGEGTFNEAELDSFAEKAGAYLSPEQSERMKAIIAGIKK
jgi:hypothetical protein